MEIALRSLAIFAVVWIVIRLSGKREVAQLSAFDIVLLVLVGDLVAQAVLHEDFSLTGALIAVTTFTMASMVLSRLAFFVPALQPLISGRPRAMIRDGKIDHGAMRSERLSRFELDEAARQTGITDLGDVDLCILEADGNFSFYTKNNSHT